MLKQYIQNTLDSKKAKMLEKTTESVLKKQKLLPAIVEVAELLGEDADKGSGWYGMTSGPGYRFSVRSLCREGDGSSVLIEVLHQDDPYRVVLSRGGIRPAAVDCRDKERFLQMVADRVAVDSEKDFIIQ